MGCPTIKYGVPSTGATEYNVNSGREIFRCGTSCVKLFITNVSLEKTTLMYGCGQVTDADAGGLVPVCLQNVNLNFRDNAIVNWIGKENVDSGLPNGTVITRIDDACNGAIYTHTEGTMNFRGMMNIEDVTVDNMNIIKHFLLEKLYNLALEMNAREMFNPDEHLMKWIFSDMNTNVSPTDWQSASGTYQGIGVLQDSIPDTERTYRISFNWNNGRSEESYGCNVYDRDGTPQQLEDVITTLITRATTGDAANSCVFNKRSV